LAQNLSRKELMLPLQVFIAFSTQVPISAQIEDAAGADEESVADAGPDAADEGADADQQPDGYDGGADAGDDGADGGASVPYCRQLCATPADCSQNLPAFDQDNYNCLDGLCVYLGCRSDEECRDSFTTYPTACR